MTFSSINLFFLEAIYSHASKIKVYFEEHLSLKLPFLWSLFNTGKLINAENMISKACHTTWSFGAKDASLILSSQYHFLENNSFKNPGIDHVWKGPGVGPLNIPPVLLKMKMPISLAYRRRDIWLCNSSGRNYQSSANFLLNINPWTQLKFWDHQSYKVKEIKLRCTEKLSRLL